MTGIAGFAGRHLTSYLAGKDNNKILGTDLTVKNFNLDDSTGEIEFEEADITHREKIFSIIKKFKPDQVYHLAAQSSVSHSWEDPVETFRINVFGGINILEGLKIFCPECRILMACTAEEYGETDIPDKPVDEQFRIFPQNPYAISKSALDFLSSVYYGAYKLPVFISRAFNHIGPGQSERFVCSDFARQIALTESGKQEPEIWVGNIQSERDFLDVRDAVKAYYFIINKGRPGQVYNVCSGRKLKISDLLDMLISFSKRSDIKVKIDRKKLRAIDVKSMYGDNSKLKNHTGWIPGYSIETSLKDTLDYWRGKTG
ncbi:MAG: GDP-mannose 4,6-dehydratase [Actinomycetota bacterium]|nr:GDP-mannose 4,6-dehydratase [Actinomycetota bacterium]